MKSMELQLIYFWDTNKTDIYTYEKFLFIWNAKKQKEIAHLLVHSSNAGKSQDRVRLNPGARNSFWVSHVDGRNPSTWAIYHQLVPRVHISGKPEVEA